MTDAPDTISQISEPQYITDPVQIAGILRRLQEGHALLHVSLPGGEESWLSAVIDVQATQGQVLLDELSPRDGNAALQRVGRLIVNAQIKGVHISFAANLVETGVSEGLVFYRVALPQGVRYWQRRASYRAQVGAAQQIPVTLNHSDGLVLRGDLVDISAGGIGSRHKDAKGIVPLIGETWDDCHIGLPDGHDIHCALEIRNVGHDSRGQLRVGSRFTKVDRAQLKSIEAFVAHLEREALRKMRRTRDQ